MGDLNRKAKLYYRVMLVAGALAMVTSVPLFWLGWEGAALVLAIGAMLTTLAVMNLRG
jgi:hypothetical protein